ncbi:MAG TPA: histidine kinase dimerization/phospho-acceptor domain-containing protein, partial [Thermoanaerobaculia bacterium]
MAETDRSLRGGLACVCKRDGTITTILRDDFAIAAVDARITDLVDRACCEKADRFILTLLRDKSAVGWQLVIASGTRPATLCFGGAVTGDTLLIVAAPAHADARDTELYDELSRLNNELINRERELARKTASLERAAAERSRLIAIAAHDLRNPLTIVASYADLLRIASTLSDEELLYVEEISRSAKFMGELVEELL